MSKAFHLRKSRRQAVVDGGARPRRPTIKRIILLAVLGCFGVASPSYALAIAPSVPDTTVAPSSIVTVAYDQQVENAQLWLNRLGFDAGTVDGLMGGRTRAAIRAYQRDRGHDATGELDRSTMRGLRQEFREATGETPGRAGSRQAGSDDRNPAGSDRPLTNPASTPLVVDTQVELRRRGYDVPVVTGELDTKTKAAIRKFEQDQRLLVTGQPSALLLERIRSTESVMSRHDLVRAVQLALTERGYRPGPADGAMGRATFDAIRTYQADAGLVVNGDADMALLEALQKPAQDQSGNRANDPGRADGTTRQITLLDDQFADGEYLRDPSWQVLSGGFSVRDGVLHSQVAPTPVVQEVLPNDVLFQVLKGLLSDPNAAPAQGQPSAAAIGTPVQIPNEFRIRVRLSATAAAGARFTFGPYQSQPSNGYQLVLEDFPRAIPTILAASSGSQLRVISRGAPIGGLENGRMHDIDWIRDATGNMTVSVDGQVVLQARDNGFSQAFDGLVMVNASGSWAVDHVRVDATAR